MTKTGSGLCGTAALLAALWLAACAQDPRADPTGVLAGAQEPDWEALRERMVEQQIAARGVRSEAVLDAMRRVPRHLFVPQDRRPEAYEDRPLPIGFGQTISQPYIVAYMTEMLELSHEDRVLEIGTGSGYQAAVLAELARKVYTIEIVPELAGRARQTLEDVGYRNVRVAAGNGWLGWEAHAPYEKIIVTAAPPEVPSALIEQLALGGTLIAPVGTGRQQMTIVTRTETGLVERRTIPVLFVPMVGGPGA